MHTTSLFQPRRLKTFITLACALAGVTWAHAYAREDARATTTAHTYGVQMQLTVHGLASAPLLTVEEDKPFAVGGDDGGKPWRAEFTLSRMHGPDAGGAKPTVRLAGSIVEDGKILARPALVGLPGERMAVKIGDDVKLAFVVNDLTP
ncbi:hypothetical protein [Massilia sp. 9096]|uniref:hypothetical protein n=1 Tax=Massilia sp. 9096 TaxID=1500894 RepID=UPI0005625DE3|nr:hypothetical protein [Massilia sp. 9096]